MTEAALRYFVGSGGGLPLHAYVSERLPCIGKLLSPSDWRNPFGVYALDNGVYGAFLKGRVWDQGMHEDWIKMLDHIPADNPPLWILLPDAVADWPRTVELASLYLPIVRAHGWPVAIALQDGCDFCEVLEMEPDWVFVAGSTEWKEANLFRCCEFFHDHGIRCHVGRVNTRRRLMLCQAAGVDSVDGTTLNKFRDATLPLIRDTLSQECFRL